MRSYFQQDPRNARKSKLDEHLVCARPHSTCFAQFTSLKSYYNSSKKHSLHFTDQNLIMWPDENATTLNSRLVSITRQDLNPALFYFKEYAFPVWKLIKPVQKTREDGSSNVPLQCLQLSRQFINNFTHFTSKFGSMSIFYGFFFLQWFIYPSVPHRLESPVWWWYLGFSAASGSSENRGRAQVEVGWTWREHELCDSTMQGEPSQLGLLQMALHSWHLWVSPFDSSGHGEWQGDLCVSGSWSFIRQKPLLVNRHLEYSHVLIFF